MFTSVVYTIALHGTVGFIITESRRLSEMVSTILIAHEMEYGVDLADIEACFVNRVSDGSHVNLGFGKGCDSVREVDFDVFKPDSLKGFFYGGAAMLAAHSPY